MTIAPYSPMSQRIGWCYEMSCPDETKLVIHVGEAIQECHRAGVIVSFAGYNGNISCPDPAIVCGIMRYAVSGGGGNGNDGKRLPAAAIVGIVIVVLVIISAVVAFVYVRRRNRRPSGGSWKSMGL
jgi:hypothetical protein